MKERPILFSAPMIRAILDGQKTQTRRLVKGEQPLGRDGFHIVSAGFRDEKVVMHEVELDAAVSEVLWSQACPNGRPGDQFWVRESWAFGLDAISSARDEDAPVVFAADGEQALRSRLCERWRPSIHMPRWASRLSLEIHGIRVERLQDISRNDALAEGIVRHPDGSYGLADTSHYHSDDPRQSFFSLWESINGDGSVMANPWVWVYDFREVQP
ncbi:hypothetical protein [Diaphorobacter caeni]|uniref:hypothetical protein n=1 Tax=Diaphorobacter caeni TaxID=2784387 RepID=UPI0018904563|nr:hypothetical protein [Diaphorobacter caeni]MBF5006885.1 hypothetical protein [Diaphorobacter caeni]